MNEAIGVDLYNQCLTGEVTKTLNAIKSDADHVPCVILGIIKNETTPKVSTDETMFTITQSDSHRGGGFCVVYRKRTAARCDESERRSMQDSELYGRSDENNEQ